MNKINFQTIATTIQKDLQSNDVFHDQDLIVSRLNDFTLYGRTANAFDYMDFYYHNHYPKQFHEGVVECCSPTMFVDCGLDVANDED